MVALLRRGEVWTPPAASDTASNVSSCIQRARSVARSDPEMSVKLTTLATSIADRLENDTSSSVCLLRSNAWREHAESLTFVGRNEEAFAALERAEEELAKGGSPDFDRARLVLTRANVLHQVHRGLEAVFQVREAAAVFLRIGEMRQFVNARLIESTILYLAGRPADALAAWRDLDRDLGGGSKDASASAMMFHTIALCFRGLGDFAGARTYFARAKANFIAAGSTADAVKVDWSVARVLLAEGRLVEAVSALTVVGVEFGRLSMRVEEALVGLDRVDALLALDRSIEARKICPPIIAAFNASGLDRETARALAYLHDALRRSSRHATEVSDIRSVTIPHVRAFIEKQAKSSSATARFEPPLN